MYSNSVKSLAELDECHILYLSEEQSASIDKIASETTKLPILVVSTGPGLAEKGAVINKLLLNSLADNRLLHTAIIIRAAAHAGNKGAAGPEGHGRVNRPVQPPPERPVKGEVAGID